MNKCIIFSIIILFSACNSKNEANDLQVNAELAAKKEELAALKTEQQALMQKISGVQAEIIKLDPSSAIKPKLVGTEIINKENFDQYLNLQGVVQSDNISYVAPRNGMGGYVKQVYIKEGQSVKSGQLILKLDDKVMQEAIKSIKTQLSFATNVYEKTKSLWDQKIGTELQLLTAQNNVDGLKNQIKVQEEQMKMLNVYADQSGIAEIVNIRAGELFTGVTALGPQVQIINNNNLNVSVDIPENYINKVKKGDKVIIEIPAAGKTFNTSIDIISQSINSATRGFKAECKIPSGINLKPNMAALAKILNYKTSDAVVVPINVVLSDEKTKYVFVMEKDENGKNKAKRRTVVLGALYGDRVEIKSGLSAGDELIDKGYQNLYEGQIVDVR